MTMIGTLFALIRAWIGSAAAGIAALLDRLVSPSVVRLVEQDDGGFRVETPAKADSAPRLVNFAQGMLKGSGLDTTLAGKRAEIVLLPRRFLFRPLELPPRAADFLDGIVRAQIDRLTPWTASEAVFGYSRPIASRADGTSTVIAATTRKAAAAFIEAAAELRPSSIALFAGASDDSAERIRVFEQTARGFLDPRRLGRVLSTVLVLSTGTAVVATAAAFYIADRLGGQEDELGRQIAQRRAAIRATGDGTARSPIAELERRKYETPASVIVLDALTRALPDHTYLTEMHLSGARLQIVGITRDAPSLIQLLEQSTQFTRATFYAPTTRALSDPGERFHIEARVEPKNAVAP